MLVTYSHAIPSCTAQAYEELHGKLEVMWAERDEALANVQKLSSDKDKMVSKIMALGLQHSLL